MASTRTPRSPTIKVECSRELLKDAIQRHSGHCFVAEAVKIAYPDATHVAVDLQTIRFTDRKKGLRYIYLTPRKPQVALVNFDQGHKDDLEPFEFKLRAGQVIAARTGEPTERKPQSPAQARQRKEAATKGRLAKARIVVRDRTTGQVPERVGGKAPPLVPGGQRREFGLRAFNR